MQEVNVEVRPDFLERQAKAQPVQALAELIWNGLDAERHQWVVPVYQRHYECETGEDRQIPKLWDDLQDEAVGHH